MKRTATVGLLAIGLVLLGGCSAGRCESIVVKTKDGVGHPHGSSEYVDVTYRRFGDTIHITVRERYSNSVHTSEYTYEGVEVVECYRGSHRR